MDHSSVRGDEISAPRRRWEGIVGVGLVLLFLLSGHQVWLIGTSLSPVGLGHFVFVLHTAAGLWVSYSGLRRGNALNRLVCLPVLLFFAGAVGLLYLRATS